MQSELFEERHLFWKKFYYGTFFGLRAKNSRPDFLKNRFRKKFFLERTFLLEKSCLFSVIAKKFFLDNWKKRFRKMFKTALQLSRGAWFQKKTVFGKCWIFLKFGPRAILFRKFCGNFSTAEKKLQSKCPQKHFEKKMFSFWRKPFFSRLGTLTEVFSNFQTKLFCQFCQYGIQRIQTNEWMKLLSYKKLELFYHFWTWNERSTEFLPENFVTFVEIVLACPGYVFRLIFFWKICKSSMSFLYLDWFSFIFGSNFLGRVCKTALYVLEVLSVEEL